MTPAFSVLSSFVFIPVVGGSWFPAATALFGVITIRFSLATGVGTVCNSPPRIVLFGEVEVASLFDANVGSSQRSQTKITQICTTTVVSRDNAKAAVLDVRHERAREQIGDHKWRYD